MDVEGKAKAPVEEEFEGKDGRLAESSSSASGKETLLGMAGDVALEEYYVSISNV